MSYSPRFTTKADVYALIEYIDEDETIIPDIAMKLGEDLIVAYLLENSKFGLDTISYTDFRLINASTFSVLHVLITNPMVRGVFYHSGEIISKGAAGIQMIFSTGDRGGTTGNPQEIDRTRNTPNFWQQVQFWIQLFLKDPENGGERIDEVEMAQSNFQDRAVAENIRIQRQNSVYPRRY